MKFEGQAIVIVGLGLSGFASARALADRGAQVFVTELEDSPLVRDRAAALRSMGVTVEMGGHDLESLRGSLAIVSPGIPPWAPPVAALRTAGVPIWSEIELAFRLSSCEFIAVTGTNGKTTTTALIAAMLGAAGRPAVAAGNIGYPLVEAVAEMPESGVIAVEVSSFQLHDIDSFRPHVAVILNVAEDHTDWHGSFDDYVKAKQRIVENQKPDDVVVANLDDPIVTAMASTAVSRIVPFSVETCPSDGAGLKGDRLVFKGRPFADVRDLTLPGMPGRADALAAAAAAFEFGVDEKAVLRALKSFRPLAHRMERVAEAGGITFIDDSKATNPHAVLAALRGLRDVVLIAGGRTKGVDLSVLRNAIPPIRAVVALGEAAHEIEGIFDGLVDVAVVASMEEAVVEAARRAVAGGSVLLSPACASLDMYESYAARGEAFAGAVAHLLAGESGPAGRDARAESGPAGRDARAESGPAGRDARARGPIEHS